jgi:hypothetical protein
MESQELKELLNGHDQDLRKLLVEVVQYRISIVLGECIEDLRKNSHFLDLKFQTKNQELIKLQEMISPNKCDLTKEEIGVFKTICTKQIDFVLRTEKLKIDIESGISFSEYEKTREILEEKSYHLMSDLKRVK